MKIDRGAAIRALSSASAAAEGGRVDSKWMKKVEELSRLCEEGVSKTHIAFLGTSMLAKAVAPNVDLFAIKPDHAADNPLAYSARSLCHGVLVPQAADLGISLGVTGREPLNNQPYFRMTHLDDGTPVHSGGRQAFDYMVSLVRELQQVRSRDEAQSALTAFVAVRRLYQPRYAAHSAQEAVTQEALTRAIQSFVREASEGGRRAQGVAAGLFDTFAGAARVESGRINDPSRKYPGDVCIRAGDDGETWAKAVEVRDKPVTASDIQIFANKCVAMGVREAAVLMVADQQQPLDELTLRNWADKLGIGLTLFIGWPKFVDQVLFWSPEAKPIAAAAALGHIHARLVQVEASETALKTWKRLTAE